MCNSKTDSNLKASIFSLGTAAGTVSVAIARSHRRTFQLTVDYEGAVTFKVPFAASAERVKSILNSKSAWVDRARARAVRRQLAVKDRGYHDGATFFVFGSQRILRVQEGGIDWPRFSEVPDGWQAHVPAQLHDLKKDVVVRKALELWFRRKAEEYLPLRLDLWSMRMGLVLPRITIKRHKRLWGSCNKFRRAVNLNWRIVSFPPEVIDYVIIHELCHLHFADHSRRFWVEVAQWCPQWREFRQWLKEDAFRYVLPERFND